MMGTRSLGLGFHTTNPVTCKLKRGDVALVVATAEDLAYEGIEALVITCDGMGHRLAVGESHR